MELYYDGPMQLTFWRDDLQVYHYGIGCHEYIIDVHDGALFSTKEILEKVSEPDDAAMEYSDWKDLSKDFNKIDKFRLLKVD